jgi:hypothetical protein
MANFVNGEAKDVITVEITHRCVNGMVVGRSIDVYERDENGIKRCAFSEFVMPSAGSPFRTKSGVAGAVNLLCDLLSGDEDGCYYQNDGQAAFKNYPKSEKNNRNIRTERAKIYMRVTRMFSACMRRWHEYCELVRLTGRKS